MADHKNKKRTMQKMAVECKNCGGCCNHISMEIDKPTCKSDYQDIMWFILHKNVKVWINDKNDWYIEFLTPCEWRKDGRCINHTKRPGICKDYSPEDCVNNDTDMESEEKHSFNTYEDFVSFLKKKKIDYEFKWQADARKPVIRKRSR